MGPRELKEEAGFPDTRLSDYRGQLAATGAGLLESPVEVLDLGVASYEPAERPRRHRLQSPTDRSCAGDLEDLDGVGHTLHGHKTEGLHVDVAFGHFESVGGDQDCAGACDLLHPGGEVRRLTNRRVVHMEIAADRADDDLARIHPDADLDGHALRAQELPLQRGNARLHPEGGIA